MNEKKTGSYLTKEDCLNIEVTVKEWIDEGNNDPEKHDSLQSKVKGAICIINKIDNVKVSTTRNNKDDDIESIQLETLY